VVRDSELPNFGSAEVRSYRIFNFIDLINFLFNWAAGRRFPPPSSLQASINQAEVLSTIISSPATDPVELRLAAGEEQGTLYGEPSTTPDDDEDTPRLALPQALVTRQY